MWISEVDPVPFRQLHDSVKYNSILDVGGGGGVVVLFCAIDPRIRPSVCVFSYYNFL